jgi:hypothetical protein
VLRISRGELIQYNPTSGDFKVRSTGTVARFHDFEIKLATGLHVRDLHELCLAWARENGITSRDQLRFINDQSFVSLKNLQERLLQRGFGSPDTTPTEETMDEFMKRYRVEE